MTDTFNFTDEEFLQVVNMICEKDHPLGQEFTPIISMDESLAVDRLDSLGIMIFFTWLSELFGISDKLIEDFTNEAVFTITAIKEFVTNNATRTYDYVDGERLNPTCS